MSRSEFSIPTYCEDLAEDDISEYEDNDNNNDYWKLMTDKIKSYLGCELIPDKYKDHNYFRNINNVYRFHYELLCGKVPSFLDWHNIDKDKYLNDYMKLALGVHYQSYDLNTYCNTFKDTKWCIVYNTINKNDEDLSICIDGITSSIRDDKFKINNEDINDLKFLFHTLRHKIKSGTSNNIMYAYVLKLPTNKQFIIKNPNLKLPVNVVILSGVNTIVRLCHPNYRERTFECVGFRDNNIIYSNFIFVAPAHLLPTLNIL